MRVVGLTALALGCFAGNSLLCRLALAEHHADAGSFTAIRLLSGALVLALLARGRTSEGAKWPSAIALFFYAAPFSYAYLRLGAAIGALVLFACVQATMIGWGIVGRGERPSALSWLGILIALGGLIALTVPGKSAPDPIGAVTMAVAGIAWGVYSLRGGKAKGDPIALTSSSFTRAALLVLPVLAIERSSWNVDARGIALAIASGAICSGIGYSIWYAALRGLTATRAATLQLLVPILAAGAAVSVLDEQLTVRLAFTSVAILGGVALSIAGRIVQR